MSISSSIDFRIIDVNSGEVASPIKILQVLINNGWSVVNKNGYVAYVPVGDDGDFDWQAEKMDVESLFKILKEKELLKELTGVNMFWNDTYIGGSVLFWDSEVAKQKKIHTPMAFSLNSDRKIIEDNENLKITDVNWYLMRLLPVLNKDGLYVEYYTYEEHI